MKKIFSYLRGFLITSFLFLDIMPSFSQEMDNNPDWKFFQDVPNYKMIKLSGSNWTMSIDDAYCVTFSASMSDSSSSRESGWSQSASFEGTGLLQWRESRLVIDLSIDGRGQYSSWQEIYQTRRERVAGSGLANFLFGDGSGADYRTYREYVRTDRSGADGHTHNNYQLYLEIRSDGFHISGFSCTLNMYGAVSRTVTLNVPEGIYKFAYESKSAETSAARDQFGKWEWNRDRSKIYLTSVSGQEKFVIWNQGGELAWSFELPQDAQFVDETVIETGETLMTLSMSLDGGSARQLTFAKIKPTTIQETKQEIIQVPRVVGDSTVFVDSIRVSKIEKEVYNENDMFFVQNMDKDMMLLRYAVYNRFLGTLEMRSKSMLDEFKTHKILMLNYKKAGQDKSAMFRLEGLESLMYYLQGEDKI